MSKIFYNSKMAIQNESESRSAEKPKLFVQLIESLNIPIQFESFSPITKDDLLLAHNSKYINAIFNGDIPNGFMNYNMQVPTSALYTIGSLLAAAKDALSNKTINCSPTSGFHHACYAEAQGYCTFNGLIVTAQLLKKEGLANKIGILDCDFHYGNGTDDIIKTLNLDYITHVTLGKTHKSKSDPNIYLDAVKKAMIELNECDIILYQAGADLSIHDPLGGILSDDEMKLRDNLVFSLTKKPLVWNLAGGYQSDYQKTLNLHIQTLKESLKYKL